ncbi:MAG: SDR family NAD(P)-dependent oxidoreductase [Planctomycetota bacterium]
MRLEGARVILTGATRGIGAALARALAKKKARQVLVARSAGSLDELASECGEARAIVGDVADPATARRAVAEAIAAFWGVDLLINNAAILTPPRPVVKSSHEEWRAVLDVNVLGTVAFLREVLPVMEEQGRGVCVNLSSGWGRSADADVAPYVASKWAVEGLSRAVALEVKAGICVVAVNPGIIKTEMLETAFGVREASGFPSPGELAPRFLRMLEKLGPDRNGQSLDAMTF